MHTHANTQTHTDALQISATTLVAVEGDRQSTCARTHAYKHTQRPCIFQQPHSLQWQDPNKSMHTHANTQTHTDALQISATSLVAVTGERQSTYTHAHVHTHTEALQISAIKPVAVAGAIQRASWHSAPLIPLKVCPIHATLRLCTTTASCEILPAPQRALGLCITTV